MVPTGEIGHSLCCCGTGSQVMTGPLLKPGVWEGKSGMLISCTRGKDGHAVNPDGVDIGIGAYVPEGRVIGILLARY